MDHQRKIVREAHAVAKLEKEQYNDEDEGFSRQLSVRCRGTCLIQDEQVNGKHEHDHDALENHKGIWPG